MELDSGRRYRHGNLVGLNACAVAAGKRNMDLEGHIRHTRDGEPHPGHTLDEAFLLVRAADCCGVRTGN